MKIAIEGCCHGELDAIYRHIQNLETKNQYKVDLLLICGDFQAIRNHRDLQCMAVPPKYRQLGGFHKYYIGETVAPVLTLVIGGNHEASNYLWELYHGGWLAPNIYFLGHAGCVQVNGIRIAGASGIFKGHDYRQGSWETVPYDHGSMRSIYHIRDYSVCRLSLLSSPHIFLSHDWPQSIEHHGDLPGLLRRKSYFRDDINSGKLGSPPLMSLLRTLRPQWWFSAHLHVRFEATVIHDDSPPSPAQPVSIHNPDEIKIDDDEDDEQAEQKGPVPPPPLNPDEISLDDDEIGEVIVPSVPATPSVTRFLALDKCLPRRDFLEVVDIATPPEFDHLSKSGQQPILAFDPEWLAISRAFHPYFSTTRQQSPLPDDVTARELVKKELEWVRHSVLHNDTSFETDGLPKPYEDVSSIRRIEDCQKFVMTAPGPGTEGNAKSQQPPWYTNPQTVAFCDMLQIENKINPPPSGTEKQGRTL